MDNNINLQSLVPAVPVLKALCDSSLVLADFQICKIGEEEKQAIETLLTYLGRLHPALAVPKPLGSEASPAKEQEKQAPCSFVEDYNIQFQNARTLHTRGSGLGQSAGESVPPMAWDELLRSLRVQKLALQWKQKATKHQQELSGKELEELLTHVKDWQQYDLLAVNAKSGSRPLLATGMALLTKLGIIERLRLPRAKLRSYLEAVESTYRSEAECPYHNKIHAADVVQSVGCMISMDEQLMEKLTDLEVLALIIAAAVHDAGHPGVNNYYLVRARDPAALRYNDRAVNENGHLYLAFSLLMEEDNNFMQDLPDEDWRYVRRLIIDIVLATDMAVHNVEVQGFTSALALLGPDLDKWQGEARLQLLRYLVHAADISNPGRPWRMCREWAERVTKETLAQGDKEREAGMPVTPLCDREKAIPVKGQHVFCEHFARPTFVALGPLAPRFVEMAVKGCDENKARWEELLAKGETQIPAE